MGGGRARHGAADCWPLGYTNDALAYFCTPQQHEAGGYEPNAYMYDDEPAPYEGEAEAIIKTATRLMEKMHGRPDSRVPCQITCVWISRKGRRL